MQEAATGNDLCAFERLPGNAHLDVERRGIRTNRGENYLFTKTLLPRRIRRDTFRRGDSEGEGVERNRFLMAKPMFLPWPESLSDIC